MGDLDSIQQTLFSASSVVRMGGHSSGHELRTSMSDSCELNSLFPSLYTDFYVSELSEAHSISLGDEGCFALISHLVSQSVFRNSSGIK